MKNYKIFGIGRAKTGTTTLGVCFETLGFTHKNMDYNLVHCYQKGDLETIFREADKYETFEDWPWPLLYKELDQHYPDSKFILTMRDAESCYESHKKMIIRLEATPEAVAVRKIIYGEENPIRDKKRWIEQFEQHNREVKEFFKGRENDLLVVDWSKGDGWPQLCSFLDKPIPNGPFPHAGKGTKPGFTRNLIYQIGNLFKIIH
jgi:hypothetical protein